MTCHICASPTCLGECEDYPRCKKCGDYMHPNFPCEETKALREPEEEYDLVYRLRKRAEIRRQIPNRRSVQEGKPDRIADILEEAAREIELLRSLTRIPSLPKVSQYEGCPVCGIGKNGEAMGYVCYNPKCPTRITCL